jgi:hypothetical protein
LRTWGAVHRGLGGGGGVAGGGGGLGSTIAEREEGDCVAFTSQVFALPSRP